MFYWDYEVVNTRTGVVVFEGEAWECWNYWNSLTASWNDYQVMEVGK